MPRKTQWTTDRVAKAVEMLAVGRSHTEVASALGISVSAVEGAKHRGIKTLDVPPLKQLVAIAKRDAKKNGAGSSRAVLRAAAVDAETAANVRISDERDHIKANVVGMMADWTSAKRDAVRDARDTIRQEGALLINARAILYKTGEAIMPVVEGLAELAPMVKMALLNAARQAAASDGHVDPIAALDLYDKASIVMGRYVDASRKVVDAERIRIGDPRDLLPKDRGSKDLGDDLLDEVRTELAEYMAMVESGDAVIVDDEGEPVPVRRRERAESAAAGPSAPAPAADRAEEGELAAPPECDDEDDDEMGEPVAADVDSDWEVSAPAAAPAAAEKRVRDRPSATADPAHVRQLLGWMRRYDRVAVVGGPWSGKSTLVRAVEAHPDFDGRPVYRTDDYTDKGGWSEQPALLADDIGNTLIYLVEGVQVARALRKRSIRVDAVLYIRGTRNPRPLDGQERMTVAVETVLTEWRAQCPQVPVFEILVTP